MAFLTWRDAGVVKARVRDTIGMAEVRTAREEVRERKAQRERDDGRIVAMRLRLELKVTSG